MDLKDVISAVASIYKISSDDIHATSVIPAAFIHPPGYLCFIIHMYANNVIIGPRNGIHPRKNPVIVHVILPKTAVITADL